MSRVGKTPIVLPENVTVEMNENKVVVVKGPKGTLEQQVTGNIALEKAEHEGKNAIVVVAGDGNRDTNAKHGLYRALIANMVAGVSQGFSKSITINGVGFKCQVQGNKLVLNIGFSHPVNVEIPSYLTVTCPSATEILVSGISKEQVGQFAADVKAIKKVEPYHGYGIYYTNEHVRRKEIKKTSSGKK
ncbi:MAG: 50S ribosomal protein L6 [Clostridia bacterium]|nr:50S ribosomal protein L6 [Clostridia bacterium]